MLILMGAAYGIVALSRGTMLFDLTFTMSQARYHYGQTAALVAVLGVVIASWGFRRASIYVTYAALPMILAYALANRRLVPDLMDEFAPATRDVVVGTEAELERAVSGAPEGSDVYVENQDFTALSLLYVMGVSRELFPDIAGFAVVRYGLDPVVNGRHLRFVEHDAELVKGIRRTHEPEAARLFITDAEAHERGIEVVELERTCLHVQGIIDAMNENMSAVQRESLRQEIEASDTACTPGPRLAAIMETAEYREKMLEAIQRDPTARAKLIAELRADPEARAELRAAIEADPEAREAMRAAITADPETREAMRAALKADSEAREAMRATLKADPVARKDMAHAIQADSEAREEMRRALAPKPATRRKTESTGDSQPR
jgi:hypothetical protein